MNVVEVQEKIFNEINNPEEKIHLRVQKKQINRKEYLNNIYNRCIKYGLETEEAEDIRYLVEKSLWGFGIIDDLVMDPTISDIRLVDENTVRIKTEGKRKPTGIKFQSVEEYKRFIEFITNRNNITIPKIKYPISFIFLFMTLSFLVPISPTNASIVTPNISAISFKF